MRKVKQAGFLGLRTVKWSARRTLHDFLVGMAGLGHLERLDARIQDIADRQWLKVRLAREALSISPRNRRITGQLLLTEEKTEMAATAPRAGML
jgi:ABC-type cobalamin transport system ATPase subunit